MNKKVIAKSFGKASGTYDTQAPVQKWTAVKLCAYVQALNLPVKPRILEIGCGTGFLTEMLLQEIPDADWIVTDISENMLATCQERVGDIGRFHVMDGEQPDIEGGFDLIVTSLAIQWFHDLPKGLATLSHLLKEGGHLVFTTLGAETFKEWTETLAKFGAETGVHRYPAFDELTKQVFEGCEFELTRIIKQQPYDNGLAFLRALKMIGAYAPQAGYQALSAGKMRQVLRDLDKGPCSMTYDILLGHIQRN